ncbi:MAG: hypothetical protein LAQ69_35640 [Acidobacteriia bacterium]|nr:hypothetical protein [Terriglobia bacterium]
MSRRFWERRLGANQAVVGQFVRIAGKPVRVVGIVSVPRERIAVWMPLVKQPSVVECSTLLTDGGEGCGCPAVSAPVWGCAQPSRKPVR